MRFLILLATVTWLQGKEPYDPKGSPGGVQTRLVSFTYQGREVPLRCYLHEVKPAPVILLSHGLGGSREVGAYLGKQWAGRGFVVVALQHIGSDESIWKGLPVAQRMRAMRRAVTPATFLDRTRDVPATLDQLEKWVIDLTHFLHRRLNLKKIGMAGHSYGAHTTQAICGQAFGRAGPRYRDQRIDAGLALSPGAPKRANPKTSFGTIALPMMLMTGTRDRSMIGRDKPGTRRQVYAALPPGSKYELVLKDAEHMAFSDATLRGKEHRNPNHHRAIKALSTAFWEAYLKENKAARSWLGGPGPANLLVPDDIWHNK
ncbi:MAG: dienelactone hydrolase [Verrucomicrobiota bacterium]